VVLGYELKRYGKWCLVTGASSGIGLEFARAVAGEGLNLVLVARRRDRLEALAGELNERNGIETRVIVQDLSLPDAVDQVGRQTGDIEVDMLVLNAGLGYYGSFLDMGEEEIARMISLNCTSAALIARRFIPGMIQRKRGAVIVVSSVLGFFPGPWASLYSATKAFDLMFGESLRQELKAAGVDMLSLCPASTATEFHDVASGRRPGEGTEPKSRQDDPADIVRMALHALGRKSTVFTLDGWAASLLTRTLPRKWVAALAAKIMAIDKGIET
jgi:short-subunit dehydrogenase